MRKCKECGSVLPCVNTKTKGICKECDEQFLYCFNECKNPCRSKEEQKSMFDKVKEDWQTKER